MIRKASNIIIVDASEIIFEGISGILSNSGQSFNINHAENLNDIEKLNLRASTDIFIINPLLIQNQLKEFQLLKKEMPESHWIGIIYSFVDPQLLILLDDVININDKPNKIAAAIQKLLISNNYNDTLKDQQEALSERETDVLKLLVAGNANKEIADKLNISIHTVISHRKNISQKTGIKSVSGLTIYAVVKNIISIDNYLE